MLKIFILCAVIFSGLAMVASHGMLMVPPNRSSLWRFDPTSPANYDDSGNFCGGAWAHHGVNKGKCGVCGDNYQHTRPRSNENTGRYGGGKIVAYYHSGEVIDVEAHITANHLGFIQYHICKIENSTKPESGEECFIPLLFEDGNETLKIMKSHRIVRSKLRLPKEFTCKHCTLRWTYTAGNSWGYCGDGTSKLGCGPQETFRSCADVKIVK